MRNTDLKFRTVSSSLPVSHGLFQRVKYSLTLFYHQDRAKPPRRQNGHGSGKEKYGALSLSVNGKMWLVMRDEKTVPSIWAGSLG